MSTTPEAETKSSTERCEQARLLMGAAGLPPLERISELDAGERADCGVCGIEAVFWVAVTDDGYRVPRCQDHLGWSAYQAEARLADALRD
jgi:hypothetical protein